MDPAFSTSESASQTPEESTPGENVCDEKVAADFERATPLLEALLSGRARRLQSPGSLIYGLTGVLIYTIAILAVVGLVYGILYDRAPNQNRHPFLTFSCIILLFAAAYPTAVMTLQLFASLRLPLAVRLTLIYASVYAFLRTVTFGMPEDIEGEFVLIWAPICAGGFIQHRRGWSAVAWGQQAEPASKISIATLLDLTAAVAITMGIASTSQIDARGLLCLIPACLIMAAVGMHAWGRLTSLCDGRKDRDMGLAMWMVGNAIAGCVVFLAMVMSSPGSDAAGLLGFVVGPLVVLFAHATTIIPIAWLRACGWKFVLAKPPNEFKPAPR